MVKKLYTVYTGASDVGLGAILSQLGEDEHQHPIAYASRKLKPRETHYSNCTNYILKLQHLSEVILYQSWVYIILVPRGCRPSVYTALYPYVTRGPDESCHELHVCLTSVLLV